jgi:hypothetical protein
MSGSFEFDGFGTPFFGGAHGHDAIIGSATVDGFKTDQQDSDTHILVLRVWN